MPNVGYASLQIIPSVQGIGREIQQQLTGPVTDAGDEASSGFAKRLGAGLAIGVAGVAAIAGAALVKGITGAMEQEQIAGKLGAQLGATGPQAQRYGQIAGQLYADAVTEDIQGAADAIRATMSAGLLPPEATNQQIAAISSKVSDLSTTFELDLGQAANAVGQIMKTGLAPNAEVALDTITRGLQVMGPRADDIGDTFNEYSVIFQRLGLSAQSATGLLSQGMKAGARDTDVVADALKEFTLEGVQGSKKIVDGFKAIGLNSDQMVKMIAAGGPQATKALQMTLDQLRAMKDPIERDAAATSLFGTKAEDLQGALLALDPATAVASLGEVTGAADRMGASLRDNAATNIEQFKRGLEQGLTTVVGGHVLPALIQAAGFLKAEFGPGLSQVAAVVRDSVLPAAAELAHRIADEVAPAVLAAAGWLKGSFLPAAVEVAQWLGDHLVPAALAVARTIRDDVIPAVAGAVQWLSDNRTAIGVTAGVITTLLLPVLVTTAVGYARAGVAATVSAGQQVVAWVTSGGAAVTNGALSVAASYRTVGGWIAAGAAAVASGAQQVAAWVATGARALWGMALQVGAAAAVVGGWILMGAQSLLQAARMAAAWLIAMGPVGWITAAVIALVALVIANWDTIVAGTKAAWEWIVGAVKAAVEWIWQFFLNWSLPGLLIKHWSAIKDGAVAGWNAVVDWIKQVPGWIYNAFLNFTPIGLLIQHWRSIKDGAVNGLTSVVEWVALLPVKIVDALGNLGSLLVDKGGDLVRGLWQGIQNMGGWLKDKLVGWARTAIPGPIADALGIKSPSRVMAASIGRWIPAGIQMGIEANTAGLDQTMRDLVVPPTIPEWMIPATASVAAPSGTAAAWRPAPGSSAATATTGGAALNIENYYESDSGGARQTAMQLEMLRKARG